MVLLDCDGVLVDNVNFEPRVTTFTIERLAAHHGIPHEEAQEIWRRELESTRSEPEWYDYDYHCGRLGLLPCG